MSFEGWKVCLVFVHSNAAKDHESVTLTAPDRLTANVSFQHGVTLPQQTPPPNLSMHEKTQLPCSFFKLQANMLTKKSIPQMKHHHRFLELFRPSAADKKCRSSSVKIQTNWRHYVYSVSSSNYIQHSTTVKSYKVHIIWSRVTNTICLQQFPLMTVWQSEIQWI